MEGVANLHASNNSEVFNGLDIDTGKTLDVTGKTFIMDHMETKFWSIKLATDVAITILRIDHIIMSKPAGGPKMKSNNNWDED